MSDLDDLMIFAGGMVPLLIGFLQLLKAQGLPSRLVPVASILTGVSCMVLVNAASSGIDWTLSQTVFAGIAGAMMAGGFYSGGKAVLATP